MNWQKLTHIDQLEALNRASEEKPVLIFKHSTRCSISSMTLNRLLRHWKFEDSDRIEPYFLDLIAYREVSNAVATDYGIPHASPQVLVLKSGQVVYSDSHFGISYEGIMSQV